MLWRQTRESWLRTGRSWARLAVTWWARSLCAGGKRQILTESVQAVISKKWGSVWRQGCSHSQQSWWTSLSKEQKANTSSGWGLSSLLTEERLRSWPMLGERTNNNIFVEGNGVQSVSPVLSLSLALFSWWLKSPLKCLMKSCAYKIRVERDLSHLKN